MNNYEEILRDLKSGIYDLSRLSRENMNTEEIAEYEGYIASLDKIVVDLEQILPRVSNAYSKFTTEQQEVFKEELKPDVIENVDEIKESVKEEAVPVAENTVETVVVEPVKEEVVPVAENKVEAVVVEPAKEEVAPVAEKAVEAVALEPAKVEAVPVAENTVETVAVEPAKEEVAPVAEKAVETVAVEPAKEEAAPVAENTVETVVVEPVKEEVAPVAENTVETVAVEPAKVEAVPVAEKAVEAIAAEPAKVEAAPVAKAVVKETVDSSVEKEIFIRQTNVPARAILVTSGEGGQYKNLLSSFAIQKTIFDDVMNPKDVIVVDTNKSIEDLKKELEIILQQAQSSYNSGNKEEAAKLYERSRELNKKIKEKETDGNKVLAYTN